MFSTKDEQVKFWNIFGSKLVENGEPFSINYLQSGEVKHYASVNREKAWVPLGLTIDFLCRDRIVRINIYIENDVRLFAYLYSKKEEIEKELGFKPQWVFSGTHNVNTRRIINVFPVKIGDSEDYERVIDEILPYIVQYKNVFGKYISGLFDYNKTITYYPDQKNDFSEAKSESNTNILGEIVKHSNYGDGYISKVEVANEEGKKYIVVKFSKCEKKFIYPDSFEKFLNFENEESQKRVKELLKSTAVTAPAIGKGTTIQPVNSKKSIRARTNAEFLNQLLDKNFKQWMKSGYELDSKNRIIWMIRLDGCQSVTGWKNTIVNSDLIIEEYVGSALTRLASHKDVSLNQIRCIFDIRDSLYSKERTYEFKGVFKMNAGTTTENKHVWERVSKSHTFNGVTYTAD